MTQSPKVVQLSTTARAAGRGAAPLPPIVHTVRQTTKRRLLELMQTLFNHTDDALFEMADRSRNDADQHLYFDSMREIRLHRKAIRARFGEHLAQGFNTLLSAAAKSKDDDADESSQLALLRNDELEVAVAVSGIVSKVTSQHSIAIMQLTRRLDHLVEGHTVTEKSNPLGPQRLADVFVEATDVLNIDIRVRIVLLKLFERHVMEALGPTYEEANRLLAEAGVLPDLKSSLKRESHREPTRAARRDARRPAAPGDRHAPTSHREGSEVDSSTTSIEEHAGDGFGMLQRLLAGSARHGDGGDGSTGAATARVSGPLMSTGDLMSILSAVQTDVSTVPIDLDAAPGPVDLRELLLARAVAVTGSRAGGMGRTDEDTVNLVGMLFDYILNDRNLAIPMKALIGRLQIPILRVAIQDKSFFSRTSHPARQLLNELSSAGIGWSSAAELKRDALYDMIESVVLRVLNNFNDDPGVFATLVEELRLFVTRDNHRVQIVEQRVKESESGRSKTIAAKQTVEKLVNQKASGLRLPPEVGRFISDTWSRVLVFICVRQGNEGGDWTDAVAALDDLLWSVQPLDTIEDVERRERGFAHLLDRLQRGMELISLPDVEAEACLASLRTRIEESNASDRAYLEDDEEVQDPVDLPVMEEIVLASPDDRIVLDDPDPEPEMVREINRLTEGVWVEIADDRGERTRCKLATIVQPGNRYIFVNRRGMKVAEKNRMALAVALKNGSLTVLDESQVFERALEAVIGNLRQLHKRSNPA